MPESMISIEPTKEINIKKAETEISFKKESITVSAPSIIILESDK